jgi:hypothetical protein
VTPNFDEKSTQKAFEKGYDISEYNLCKILLESD